MDKSSKLGKFKLVSVAFIHAGLFTFLSPSKADVGIGIKVGTLGPGIDATIPVVPNTFNVRLNGNYFYYKLSQSLSSIDIDAKLHLQSVGLLGDWHPFGGVFRLSAGGYYNGNEFDAVGKPNAGSSYSINGTSYSSSQVGNLTGKAKYSSSFAPYAGFGFGNSVGKTNRWTFVADFGVLFTGSPKLSLQSAGGSLSSDPTFQQNLEVQRQKSQKDIKEASFYPVIALGVAYHF